MLYRNIKKEILKISVKNHYKRVLKQEQKRMDVYIILLQHEPRCEYTSSN